MRDFSSWRLSRLLDVSAWKRLKYYHLWILVLAIALVVCYMTYYGGDGYQEKMVTMVYFLFGLTGIMFLHTILGADKYYRIKLKTTMCYIYVYERAGYNSIFQDIIFIQDNTVAHIETASTCLRENGYRSPNWDHIVTFLYCLNGDNNKWYYLSSDSDEPQFLGRKLMAGEQASIFLSGITKDGKQDLCVLHKNGIKHILADSSIISNAYVPSKAEKNIRYEQTNTRKIGEVPETYLITQNDGKYQIYGLFYTWTDYPECWEISVPAIIFQDVKDRVVLINEDGVYKELCRKLPATRWINSVIPELTKDYDGCGSVGGIVWQFDEETNTLNKLYEGHFRALGFSDGSILGDDWEYTPNHEDGTEYEFEVTE